MKKAFLKIGGRILYVYMLFRIAEFVTNTRVSHPTERHRRILTTLDRSPVLSLKEGAPLHTLGAAFGERDVGGAGWMLCWFSGAKSLCCQ